MIAHLPTANLAAAIIREVGAAFCYTPRQLLGRYRHKRVSRARQVAMKGMHLAGLTCHEIAAIFGRDVNTVYYSLKTITAKSAGMAAAAPRRGVQAPISPPPPDCPISTSPAPDGV